MKIIRLLLLILALLPVYSGAQQSTVSQVAPLRAQSQTAKAQALIYQPEKWSTLSAAQQQAVRQALKKILERGTPEAIASLPSFITLSDQHGSIEKYDALLLHALRSVPAGQSIPADTVLATDKTLAEQLSAYALRLDDFRGQIFFHNNGDLIDRGPRGLTVFKRTKELIEAGLMDFVIGNHDFWMFLNLQGLHLPYYDNFRFYGYRDDYDGRYGRVDEIVKNQLHNAEQRTPEWWAQKIAEFSVRKDKEQKNWEAPGGAQARIDTLYKVLTAGKSRDDIKRWGWTAEGKAWNSLRGHDVKVGDVYIGVRSVGMVSLKWWKDLLRDFQSGLSTLKADDAQYKLWLDAIAIIDQEVIPSLSKDLDQRLAAGEWWVRVFEAINYRNYESAEWWAKDWVFHKDWGTSILKEISPAFREDNLTGNVSFANYLKQPVLQEVSAFFRAYFSLFQQDVYGNTVIHGFLPVDAKTGEFFFNYQGQEYRGKGSAKKPSVWLGLKRIETDIRDHRRSLSDLHEALTLVNSWYADRTTIAKAADVTKAINQFGAKKLTQVNGIDRLFMGHVPFYEFQTRLTPEQRGERIQGFLIEDRIGLTDHGMGKRYGSRGAYIRSSARDGLNLYGFEHAKSEHIVFAPRTVESAEKDKEKPLATNNGLHPLVFRNELLDSLNKSKHIESSTNNRN